MSFIPVRDVACNSFREAHPPPVRKLFASGHIEDGRRNAEDSETFRVFLRIKPYSEINHSNDCIRIEDSVKLVCKPPPSSKHKKLEKVEYTFSHIFGPKTSQNEIFSKSVVDSIKDLLNSRSGLIFAYGTTNAGKTYTVQGSKKNPGIIPHAVHTIFSNIQVSSRLPFKPYMARDLMEISSETGYEEVRIKNEILNSFRASCKSMHQDSNDFIQSVRNNSIELGDKKPSCSVWISFLEVYNETIYDLLDSKVTSRKPLKIAADSDRNFYVKDLKQVYVSNAEEAFTIYQYGRKNLNIASTKMNENSSRSHCIFTIHVINLEDENNPYVSKLCICDLAGAERVSNAQSTGQRLKESGSINGSLFQLNRCLRAIRENQTRTTKQLIPYRHSNLTKLLHSALDDRMDEKIVMIVNINPSATLYDETQQVLKMCAIVSKIKNKPLARIHKRSTRFSLFLYGRETSSENQDYTPLEDLPELDEESVENSDDEVQSLLETLHDRNAEIKRLQERIELMVASHERRKKMLQDYIEKVETTYKNRIARLDERLKSQKSYYVWKVNETKKNTILENIDETIRSELDEKNVRIEELESRISELLCKKTSCPADLNNSIVETEISKKDTIIEELEKKVTELEPKLTEFEQKIMELENELENRNLSLLEKLDEKNARIKDLESLVQEAKEEYLFLENKFESENVRIHELEDELYVKNGIIEQFEGRLEENEDKITRLEEVLSEDTIEHERILHQIEKDRDTQLAECQAQITALKTQVEHLLMENCDKDLVLDHLNNEMEELKKENDLLRKNKCDEKEHLLKENKDKDRVLCDLRNEIKELIEERDLLRKNKSDEEEHLLKENCDKDLVLDHLKNEMEELKKENDLLWKNKSDEEKHLLKENNDKDRVLRDLRNEIKELQKERDLLRKNKCDKEDGDEIASARQEDVGEIASALQEDIGETALVRGNGQEKSEKRQNEPSKPADASMMEAIICLKRLHISETDTHKNVDMSNVEPEEKTTSRRYNTRAATHRTPSGKENPLAVGETPKVRSLRKNKARGRTPLGVTVLDESSDLNVFRNTVEKGKTPGRRKMAEQTMHKLFSSSPACDISETTQFQPSEKKKLFAVSPSADCFTSDYELADEDTSTYRRMMHPTPQQIVKFTKKKN